MMRASHLYLGDRAGAEVATSSFSYHYAQLMVILAAIEWINRLVDDADILCESTRATAGIKPHTNRFGLFPGALPRRKIDVLKIGNITLRYSIIYGVHFSSKDRARDKERDKIHAQPYVPRADITHPIARICTYLWQFRWVSNYHSQRSLKNSS